MILVLGVSLYTSRILLQSLGVVDLGIYNLIGGIIASLSFLNSSLAGASSRFITHALGEGSIQRIRAYYATLQYLHIALALLFIVVAQLFAHYLVYSVLDIPVDRRDTAFWLLQLFTISASISIISAPDSALIMAHERMDLYAYIAIGEAGLRLLAVISLRIFVQDRLFYFGVLTLGIQLLVNLSYGLTSRSLFKYERAKPRYDKAIGREVLSFVGWNASGSLSVIGYTQGLNVLLNIFFGPIANAARGFAVQIQTAVENIILSFQTAVRPQIIKQYAQNQREEMFQLVLMSSKYGFYLTILLIIPLLLSIESILSLWLGEVPPYTVEMSILFLCVEFISPFRIPLLSAIHATGHIRKFQIYEGAILLLVVPVAYLLLKFASISLPQVICVYLVIEILAQLVRLRIVTMSIGLSIYRYIHYLFPTVGVVLLGAGGGWLIRSYIHGIGIGAILLRSIVSVLFVFVAICFVGLRHDERNQVIKILKKRYGSK